MKVFFSKKFGLAFILGISLILSSCKGNVINDPSKQVNTPNVEEKTELDKRNALEKQRQKTKEKISNNLDENGERGENENYVTYKGVVEHIFFHPLIAYPELAFDNDYMSKGYDDYFVTVNEFNKIIDTLYSKGFILVDINEVYDIQMVDGKKSIKRKPLILPKGKKPLIISIDDLNYYDYMIKNGNVYKLILDSEGKVATYSKDLNGQEVISYTNEIIPLLDSFVERNPDFSYKGAKAIIALTGFEGVLGYRTHFESPNYQSEREEAAKVIKRLKETGWTFASHGYGHLNTPKVSLEKLTNDTKKWKAEVESLVGPTKVYIYPFGARVLPGDPRFDHLLDSGFDILCAVGSTSYEKISGGAAMTDRRHIDGVAFKQQRKRFLDLFDSDLIMDKDLRPKN